MKPFLTILICFSTIGCTTFPHHYDDSNRPGARARARTNGENEGRDNQSRSVIELPFLILEALAISLN